MALLNIKVKAVLKHTTKPKTSTQKRESGGVTKEFKQWLKEFMEEHDDVLRELAKR